MCELARFCYLLFSYQPKLVSSSALELLDTIEDRMEYRDVVLNEGAIKGLFENQREEMKRNVALANQAWRTAGSAVRGCASCLYEIKKNTPKGNWTALIKSGDLDFSESVAKDLVSAHEWLAGSNIPDRFLTNISARTIGTVARLEDGAVKEKIIEKIVETEGKGFPESELRKMMKGRNSLKINKTGAGKKAKSGLDKNATKEETIEYYTKIVDDQQAQLDRMAQQFKRVTIANQDKAGEIAKLREQIKELKAAA